jgi:PTH1 family peptidyl-tRNA hydrolase
MSLSLLVGLGNPGPAYHSTRHNLGAEVIELFAAQQQIALKATHKLFVFGEGRVDDHAIALAIPRTFMNASGPAVLGVLSAHHFPVAAMAVVYDDLDLPVGQLRIRERGSDGGHRGVRSIIETLGTREFWRVRIGIGRPARSGDAAQYVLTKEPVIEAVKAQVLDALRCVAVEGPRVAMNRYNQRRAG